ncbi:hypothetical protein HANVADRAFT_48449 [Hanseniaspora valbyensis NRRL Y-1626]|uniref:Uncharacterized protein n=1 Tax=Hanseniaspora valbyensis NRRL Y-1626 TaxID=766949 RepID=A0A1B7TEM3_9ASCO|nr:hypothetical protein HANVADRAFT_48449 [Hanseniaspora valbyensis NRRL Y-1626]
MKKPIHLTLLKDHYYNKCTLDKDETISINVREDNILKYNYSIKPMISDGELAISYIHSNCIQIKCSHINNSKRETIYFKYDYDDDNCNSEKDFDKNISIKDVIYAIKEICCKRNTRKRKYFDEEPDLQNSSNNSQSLPQCDIDYNHYKRYKKV